MIQLGADRGCPVVALLTAMDRPLGFACGNALEIRESIDALKGDGPGDHMEVTYALWAEMRMLANAATTDAQAWQMMEGAIASGSALAKFIEIIEAQGGDVRIVDEPSALPTAKVNAEFIAGRDGFVTDITPRTVGYGVISIGGGRRRMDDTIHPGVGFVIHAKPGDRVARGETLATVHAKDAAGIRQGRAVLSEAITIGDEPGISLPLVSTRISADGTAGWHRPVSNR
jgi:pyrimidine-nucleoside phosphorylase